MARVGGPVFFCFEGSPDAASRLTHHGRSRFAAEGLLELRHVLHHTVHAELVRRVRIERDHLFRELGAAVIAPDLPEAEEVALLGREAVDGFADLWITLRLL